MIIFWSNWPKSLKKLDWIFLVVPHTEPVNKPRQWYLLDILTLYQQQHSRNSSILGYGRVQVNFFTGAYTRMPQYRTLNINTIAMAKAGEKAGKKIFFWNAIQKIWCWYIQATLPTSLDWIFILGKMLEKNAIQLYLGHFVCVFLLASKAEPMVRWPSCRVGLTILLSLHFTSSSFSALLNDKFLF